VCPSVSIYNPVTLQRLATSRSEFYNIIRACDLSSALQHYSIDGNVEEGTSVACRLAKMDLSVLERDQLQCKADFSDLSVGVLILSVRPSGGNLGRKVGKKCRF
jgi:hypothetical protein